MRPMRGRAPAVRPARLRAEAPGAHLVGRVPRGNVRRRLSPWTVRSRRRYATTPERSGTTPTPRASLASVNGRAPRCPAAAGLA